MIIDTGLFHGDPHMIRHGMAKQSIEAARQNDKIRSPIDLLLAVIPRQTLRPIISGNKIGDLNLTYAEGGNGVQILLQDDAICCDLLWVHCSEDGFQLYQVRNNPLSMTCCRAYGLDTDGSSLQHDLSSLHRSQRCEG